MSNKIFTVIILTLVINISVGLMDNLPGFALINSAGVQSEASIKTGMFANSTYADAMALEFNNSVDPTTADKSGFSFSSILDFFNLGFIQRLTDAVQKYAYGLNTLVLEPLFGPAIREYKPELHTIIFGGINTIITILYALGIFWLWTGKDVITR